MTKYNAQKTLIDGVKFDSKLESRFYTYFKNSSEFILLDTQVIVELLPKLGKVRAIKYIADFLVEYQKKQYLVDSKGVETQTFKLKMNLYKRLENALPLVISKNLGEMVNQIKSVKL